METTKIVILGSPNSGKSFIAAEIAEAMKNIGMLTEIIDEPGDRSIAKRKKLLSQEGQVLGDGTWPVTIEVFDLDEVKHIASKQKTSVKKIISRKR